MTASRPRPTPSAVCSGRASRRWKWAWPTSWATSTTWRAKVKAEDIIDYTRRDNVAERLAKPFGAAVGIGAVKSLAVSGPQLR